jgi:hypothetical protein
MTIPHSQSPEVIAAAAAELRAMYEDIRRAFRSRDAGPAACREWADACRRFHAAYDCLAFPGGLCHGMTSLAGGDPAAVEAAVRFLEADPWFFRSGYIKADVIRWLTRASLSSSQAARLRRVVLARVSGRDAREFRWYCRLARRVADASLREAIRRLADSGPGPVARRAGWVARQIETADAPSPGP